MAEAEGFEPPWAFRPKLFSRQPRYDRFDMPPYELTQVFYHKLLLLSIQKHKIKYRFCLCLKAQKRYILFGENYIFVFVSVETVFFYNTLVILIAVI